MTHARIRAGAVLGPRELETISGAIAPVPDPDRLVHLQFRRFAGCPICDLHLRSVVRRHGEIEQAGVREVVLFHSTTEDLLAYEADLPVAVVADPDRHLYREFGVGSSLRATLDPRAWGPALRGIATKSRPLAADHGTGHLGLPADFLIAPDGRVVACRYGAHAGDQWSVDDLLGLAAAHHDAR